MRTAVLLRFRATMFAAASAGVAPEGPGASFGFAPPSLAACLPQERSQVLLCSCESLGDFPEAHQAFACME